MKEALYEIMKKDKEARYSLQYEDYEDGQWTLPVQLKDYRIDQFANDQSLKKVKIFHSNGVQEIFEA